MATTSVKVKPSRLREPRSSLYLGPARVAQVAGRQVALEFPDQHVWATLAVAGFYEPAAGDQVLAIGHEGGWFVIGVLQAQQPATLLVPGDLRILAPRGSIEIGAGKEVRVKSAGIALLASHLEVAARTLFERVTNVSRWIKEALELRAGRVHARVEGDYDLAAERIRERASGDVSIDGQKINLG